MLRSEGLRVVEEGNWRARAAPGSFDPIGVLWHHTAAVSSAGDPDPSLSIVINGRADLPGPLCHALLDYDGTFHLISAGRANHAGAARAAGPIPAGDGNTMLVGFEIDYAGVSPQPSMTSAQYDAAVRGTAAVLRRLGRDAGYARGHRETSTTGKVDPGGVDLDAMRADVAAVLAGGGGVGQLNGAVGVVAAGGRYDVFARAADNRLLQWTYTAGAWHGPTDLGGPIICAPAVTTDGAGRYDVFAIGSDHSLIHRIFDGSWHDWEHLGGVLHFGVGVVNPSPGRYDVFATDTDHHLVQKVYAGGSWSSWNDLGGVLTCAPSVTRRGGRYDVYATDTGHHLITRSYNGSSWTAWQDLGGQLTAAPAAVNPAAGRYDVFAADTAHHLVQKIYNGSWNPWNTIATNQLAA